MKLARYEKYKDSGVKWLGEIPEHWEAIRNMGLFDERKEVNRPDMELLSVTINRGIIKQSEITIKKDSSNEDKSKYKLVRKNDLAYNKMRMWQGAIGASKYDGIVSPAYIILRPRNTVYSKYFHYLYRTETFIKESNRNSYGLCDDMNSLRYEDFKTIYSPVPPLEEVVNITAFLDDKIGQIDQAIAKKQRLIDLLKEQKAILINNAVTRGLNPDAPTKNSGVDWIGEIPQQWEVKKMKFFSVIQSGITLGKKYYQRKLVEYPYLRVANVQDGYFDLKVIANLRLPQAEAPKYFVRKGDILVTEGGDIDKLGRGTVWKGEIERCLHQNHIFAIRINESLACPEYVAYALGVDYGKKYFTTTANKTTNLASTNQKKLGDFPVILPAKHEQQEIVNAVKRINVDYSEVIDQHQHSIDKLNEYKQILISEAVTGKIDVRKAAV